MVVAPTSKFYTVSTVLFHKYGGANFAFTNGMLYFYMFVPTKATLKLANGSTGHAQGIDIILRHFPKCSIIYIHLGQFIIFQVTLPTLYHQVPSSFILILKMIHLNLLKIVTLLTLKVVLGDQHTRLTTIFDYLHLEIVKINPYRDNNIVVPTVYGISKQAPSQLIHQRFGHVSITRLKLMARKGILEGLPENLSKLEDTCPIYILTKATKITRGPTTDVSKLAPGFMLQMYFAFFNVEIIRGFN